MIPIFEESTAGAVGYDFQQFQERFLDICAEHRAAGRALAFAFLLFDVDSPEIIKMLRDADYWRALDQISGRYLSVFTLITNEPRSDQRREVRQMAAVGPVSDPGMKVQLILRNYFGLKSRLKLPAVLFFQVDRETVSGYCLIELRATGIEPIFKEIRELLRDVAAGVAKSGSSGLSDAKASFDAIKSRLRKRKAIQVVRDGKKLLDNLREIAGLAGMLT